MDSDSKEEFSQIRGEFMTLMKEVNLDAQVEAARRDTKEELTHAYTELDRLHKKLSKEKESRKRIESELLSIKKNQKNHVDTSAEEIQRRTSELEVLQKERDSMGEWLERGKEESIRITNDESESRTELEAAEARCAALSEEKIRLTSQLKQLTEDLMSVRDDLETIEEEKNDLTSKLTECSAKALNFEKKNIEAEGNLNEVKEECQKLSLKVRQLGDYEGSLVDMCNCVAELIDEVTELNSAISDDKLDGVAPSINQRIKHHRVNKFAGASSLFSSQSPGRREGSVMSNAYGDSDQNQETFNTLHGSEKPSVIGDSSILHDAGNEGGPSIADARELIQALHDGVSSLSDTVYRFIKEKQTNYLEVQRMQQDELAAIQRDKEELIQHHEQEKEEMRQRTRELEREVAEVAAKTDLYTKKTFERQEELNQSEKEGEKTAETLTRENSKWIEDIEKEVEKDVAGTSAKEMATLFQSLDNAYQESGDLQQTILHLRGENNRLRSLASGRKIDWVKVNESRHRYQQLVVEVEMTKNYQKKLEAENAHLETVAKLHRQLANELPEQAAARRYAESQRRKIGKLAFAEWKQNLLGGASCDDSAIISPSDALRLMDDGEYLDGVYN